MSPDADAQLIDRSVTLATELLTTARAGTSRRERRRQVRLRRVLASQSGTRLVFSLADRVLRPVDSRTAAREFIELTAGDLGGASLADRGLLHLGAVAARLAPGPVVRLIAARLRRETGTLVYPAEPKPLGRRLAALRSAERRPNLNLIGEAILGWREAESRTAAVETLLGRDDVDCISVKVSAVAARLSLVDFEGSLAAVTAPLERLYRAAQAAGRRSGAAGTAKLVNLDMEEHGDLDLTVEAFVRVLEADEFGSLTAGIALQAYLPDSHAALDRLLEFARARQEAGRAPIRIRLVKGANLAQESVQAELHGWPAAPYPTKAETDASYVRLLERLIEAAAGGSIGVGVASHNLFDVALALILAEESHAQIDIEMLAGMADNQAAAVAEKSGHLLFYVPVTTRAAFRNALAYLARRLDENTSPEGFLRHALEMTAGSAAWKEQSERFGRSVRERHQVRTEPFQSQDRWGPATAPVVADGRVFANQPDTDLTVAGNRRWAVESLRRPARRPPDPATMTEIDTVVARATEAGRAWEALAPGERRRLLEGAAQVMEAGRGAAISVMASEAGKTFAEADPEVSEGVDFARWYAEGTSLLESLDPEVASEPCGVVVVTPPWNFPYAIPAGGVLAGLAAGNAVILKPSPEAVATSGLLVEQLQEAGLGDGRVQLVAAPDGDEGRHLVSHPGVGAVVLTGSWDTARMFAGWTPGRRLLGETNGKNAMVVTATADVDQAVADLVRSAFGHAGQKCSAASLAIVEASVYDRSPFLRQLADATEALRVGPGRDPRTDVGPIVGPFTESLERALTRLDPGESWLVAPRCLDEERRLWSPGIRIGVAPGSWAHRNEWFGPVLGVMRAENLEEAVEWQNDVAYGLTAGLHSLDPAEHRRWVDRVEAGNLYVNRSTTGAIVGRQPFGGWKRSSVGPTAKAGGPNYLLGLRRWHDREEVGVDQAVTHYRRWFVEYFGRVTELAGLSCESNQLRYRPFGPGVTVRITDDCPEEEMAKALAAATLTGTPVKVSSSGPRPGWKLPSGTAVAVESGESLAASLSSSTGGRLRLLGKAEPEVLAGAAAHGVNVLDEPICSHGRVELVRWLHEQVVTRSLHRYGNIVYEPLTD